MDRGNMWQGIRNWLKPAAADVVDSNVDTPDASNDSCASNDSRASDSPRPFASAPEYLDHARGAVGTGDAAVLDASFEASEEAELLEFLASDLDPVPVDPVFRERLREELWDMVVKEGVGSPIGAVPRVAPHSPARLRIVGPHEASD